VKILALDTSVPPGSVAAANDFQITAGFFLDPQRKTTQTFALALQAAVRQSRWTPADIELVAISTGPGSFTGLRIAVTAAKAFAYAAGCQVLGISSLRVIAEQLARWSATNELGCQADASGSAADAWARAAGSSPVFHAVMNAQRGDMFAAAYRYENRAWREIMPPGLSSLDHWLAGLNAGDVAGGPGLVNALGRLPAGTVVAPMGVGIPQAATLALLAAGDYQKGVRQDLWQLKPVYFRPSAAEEKRAAEPSENPAGAALPSGGDGK